ncbi:MAG: hypothetical protein CSB34_04900 [Desulfobulbus propionicus]|nr:MAG: hypothetical protein CSB34_04900 [Desulfobulbus propionicus]
MNTSLEKKARGSIFLLLGCCVFVVSFISVTTLATTQGSSWNASIIKNEELTCLKAQKLNIVCTDGGKITVREPSSETPWTYTTYGQQAGHMTATQVVCHEDGGFSCAIVSMRHDADFTQEQTDTARIIAECSGGRLQL